MTSSTLLQNKMSDTTTAISYSQKCYDSVGDYLHGAYSKVDEVFIPEYNLCYNIQKGEKPKLNIFECSKPRIISDAVNEYRNKIVIDANRKQMEQERANYVDKTKTIVFSPNPVTIDINAPVVAKPPPSSYPTAADFPHLTDEILVPQFTQKLTQDGTLKTIEIPTERVKKLLQILTTQKLAEKLREEWLNEFVHPL